MKKLKPLIIASTLVLLGSTQIFAQGEVGELIKTGPENAQKLALGYLNPFFKGFGFGMNSAWYNSAKAKNLGRFDLKIQGTLAIVPEKDQSFDITKVGLSNNVRANGSPITPTAFGEDKTGAKVDLYTDDNKFIQSFNMPNGTGFSYVPSPQIQLTVGLIKNTDVSLRYTPKVGNSGDFGTLQVLGFVIKHEITKLIMPGKTEKIVPIDIALAFGYNQLTYNYSVAQADQLNDNPARQNEDLKQRVETKFSGYTFDAILSKKLLFFTPFVSVGYNTAKSDLNLLGEYVVQTDYNRDPITGAPTTPKYTSYIDPIKVKQNDIAGIRANVGFSLHLAIFRLYGSYSVGDYQAVSAGIGLGIGK